MTTTETEMGRTAPRRRRLSLSLRALMLVILAIGLLLGWRVNRARTQVRAVARIQALGGVVVYDHTFTGVYPYKPKGTPWGPAWLRKRLGDAYFQEVTAVRFYRPNVTDADLAVLADLDRLLALELKMTNRITDAGLVHLRRLKRLRHIQLIKTRVTEAGLAHLAALPALESLQFNGEPITDAGLARIGALRGLRKLRLSNLRVTPAGLARLQALTALTDLSVGGESVKDAGLAELAPLRRLRTLKLSFSRISDAGIAPLEQFQALESLDLTSVVDIGNASLATIARLPRLRTLNLGGTQVTDAGLAHLRNLRALETLDLSSDLISDAGLAPLEALPRLRLLIADGTGVTRPTISRLAARTPPLNVLKHQMFFPGPMPAWLVKKFERDGKAWDDYWAVMEEYEKLVASGAPHGPIPPPPGMPFSGMELRRRPGVRVLGFLLGR